MIHPITMHFKKTESHAGSVGFLRVLFFHLFFYFVFFIAKIPRFISKQKNQSCEKNLGQVHSGLFSCIFLFLFGFFVVPSPTVQKLEVFAVPSPTVQKLEENQKKTKKNNPVRRILGKSIQDCFFVFFGLFGFSRGFCCPKPNCPKTRGKQKKKQKKQSCEKNLG